MKLFVALLLVGAAAAVPLDFEARGLALSDEGLEARAFGFSSLTKAMSKIPIVGGTMSDVSNTAMSTVSGTLTKIPGVGAAHQIVADASKALPIPDVGKIVSNVKDSVTGVTKETLPTVLSDVKDEIKGTVSDVEGIVSNVQDEIKKTVSDVEGIVSDAQDEIKKTVSETKLTVNKKVNEASKDITDLNDFEVPEWTEKSDLEVSLSSDDKKSITDVKDEIQESSQTKVSGGLSSGISKVPQWIEKSDLEVTWSSDDKKSVTDVKDEIQESSQSKVSGGLLSGITNSLSKVPGVSSVSNVVSGVTGTLKNVPGVGAVNQVVSDVTQLKVPNVGKLVGDVKDSVVGSVGKVTSVVTDALPIKVPVVGGVVTGMKDSVSKVTEGDLPEPSGILGAVQNSMHKVSEMAASTASNAVKAGLNAPGTIAKFTGVDKISDAVQTTATTEMIKSFFSGIVRTAKNVGNGVINAVG